ncbi:MAG: response regulator [Terracidiphilus sp.]
MTTELTQPQSEMGPAPANGQGQSQGHRRRRRRRKNKSSQAAGAVPVLAQQSQQPQAEPTAQPQRPPAKHKPAPQHQVGHQGGKREHHERKKKKFFQKGAAAAQPGNSITSPPQGKRKTRQKGPREFVGPMDHSYRLVNGNIADGPPSTIPTGSNGHNGGYYPEAYDSQPAVAVREDAPTRIYCFIEDMFFLAKIQETARKLGVKVEFVKNGDKDAMVATLAELPENERPKLLVFDLNNLNAKPLMLIPKFKAKLKKATSIVGFLNHLQGELKVKALEAGCDTVMPRSAFSQSLPNMLRRYGMEEEEEYAVQPA